MTHTNSVFDAYQATLPKKHTAAGVLFHDEHGRFLIVKPTYREGWLLPGGTIDANESPRQAAEREVKEELGLDRVITNCLLIEYFPTEERTIDRIYFTFDGGVLTSSEIANIKLPADELSEFAFVTAGDMENYSNAKLAARLREVLAARGVTQYIERQSTHADIVVND